MYNLNMHEAIDAALEGKWVQGENFASGVIMTCGVSGYGVNIDTGSVISTYNFKTGLVSPMIFSKNTNLQKFRIIETQQEAMKK
ncbi:hypothetical protein ZPAH1_orf00085 [Aeromonas phage ZPAH1]|nr:hypothetical protein ASwh1_37 [Aeromonas phage Aswh_1]QQG33847.1 hypothetical protein ZPAH1_orf00085 [Aeromonas phage ZPAH1]